MGNFSFGTLPHRPLHKRPNNIPSRSIRSLLNSEANQKMGNRLNTSRKPTFYFRMLSSSFIFDNISISLNYQRETTKI